MPASQRHRLFLALFALFQGAGAAQEHDAQGFRHAVPGRELAFPRDHGSHPDFQIEWWYFTGNLEGVSGREYGFELTFFRVGVKPPGTPRVTAWDLHDLQLAHFAVSDIDRGRFRYAEKVNRGSRFTAGAAEEELRIFNEGWSAAAQPDGTWRIRARTDETELDLVLRSRKPPAVHGEEGVSVKGDEAGAASHYYSMTRLEATGSIRSGENAEAVEGLAWMDHEFSTSVLASDQVGWDWFGLQLDDGTELMLYQIRRDDGTADPASSGSFVRRDGTVEHLTREDFSITPRGSWHSPESGATYPMGWTLAVPPIGLELKVDPAMENQELVTTASTGITYWEGAVRVRSRDVDGLGYVELTGYAAPFRMKGASNE